MDMDLDTAWCLVCSRQLRDARKVYCSDECKIQDAQPRPSTRSMSITSQLPLELVPSTPTTKAPKAASPVRRIARLPSRPPLTPLHGGPAEIEIRSHSHGRVNPPRDRRAFSFPATQAPPPPPININKSDRPVFLQFARRQMGASLNSGQNSPGLMKDPNATLRAPNGRLAKSTGGANTPFDPDLVFCSTSESEGEQSRPSPLRQLSKVTPATSILPSSASMSRKSTSKSHRASLPLPEQPALASYPLRTESRSPVAALVASSASSRSREDIITWAKAVGLRPGSSEDTSEDEADEERGRSRTRRDANRLVMTPTEPQSPRSPRSEDLAAGTTPKGRIGSAFANGLGLVRALTTSASPRPDSSLLQSGLAEAKISQVEVMSTSGGISIPAGRHNDSDVPPSMVHGANTPTLSTLSFSEAVDPSVNDHSDHVDIVTNDDAYSTSSYPRHHSAPKLLRQSSNTKAPLPLRPITTTATAIWNLSTYIRSFAPFSISSVIAPYGPFGIDKSGSGLVTPATVPETIPEEPVMASSPVPAGRAPEVDPEADSAAQEMVRSLPMAIVMPTNGPGGASAIDERMREREVREYLERSNSRHGRSPSPSRRPSRSRSSRSASSSSRQPAHVRKTSYDADGSDEEADEADDRRGRSRRGKALPRESARPNLGPARRLSEGVMGVLGERSESRGEHRRGRDRAVVA